ncbi:MAG TPA: GntR family transcriptional regulator [Stellaceae bacterium]|nr:GntR family transcriptional regulator [Stellaceae bacterium]
MPRTNNVSKRASNLLLDFLADFPTDEPLPSVSELARKLDVSRTTIRAATGHVTANRIVVERDGRLYVARAPRAADYFAATQILSRTELVEQCFMERVFAGELKSGQPFSETDLARASGASLPSVREFLIGFSRFGLIEKRPRGGWTLHGFSLDFANELADMRRIIELAAMDALAEQGADAAIFSTLPPMIARHHALKSEIATRYLDFPKLDREFHLWVISGLNNRFTNEFFDLVSLIFHYHFQWRKDDEMERNAIAIDEHLLILDALSDRDFGAARQRLSDHLAAARTSLMRSIRDEPHPS